MINLVQRKKWKIKKTRRLKLISLKIFSQLDPKLFKIWLLIIFLLAVILSIYYIFKKTLRSENNIINSINYVKTSVDQYDEPYLYKKISTLLKWENYYTIKSLKQWDIIKQVKEEFPIVQDIEIKYAQNNVVTIKIFFYKPDIIIKNQDLKFGVYNWYIFQIYSWNTIWSWIQRIFLPDFLSWNTSLEWIFFDITYEKFLTHMNKIFEAFPYHKRIIYLPGWQRTIVEIQDNQRVYINNAKDIDNQIKNFRYLEKYYSNFANIKQIDLGSLEEDKLIISH